MADIRGTVARAVRPLSPRQFPYPNFLLALVAGFIGACVFLYFGLPLPWMLGPLCACLIASLMQLPVRAPSVVRPPMTMLVGVLLGAGFTPELLSGVGRWIPSLLGLVAFLAVAAALCVTYFRKVAGFDLPTAYFAAMPGGLVEMVTVGQAKGGDARTIALVHSSRILLIVLSLPIVLDLVTGEHMTSRPQSGLSVLDAPWTTELWLLATGIAGLAIGRLLRFPAADLMGPMLASAAVHMSGITEFKPPYELVAAAQLVLGTVLGCRFAGVQVRSILRILLMALGSTLILVACTVTFSLLLSRLIGLPMLDLLLAYSPGGLTETSLVALALHVEVAFVATHHVARVLLILVSAALAFRVVERIRGRRADP